MLIPIPVRSPVPQPENWLQRSGHWMWDHKVQIGVGVVVTAVVASNFLTAGLDTEVDPLVAGWPARTLQSAGSAAPALAH